MTESAMVPGASKAAMKKIALIHEAADVAGHVPLYGERGTYPVRRIVAVLEDGSWATNCLTPSLASRVKIPRTGQARFIERAQAILAQRDQITAERDRSVAAALGR